MLDDEGGHGPKVVCRNSMEATFETIAVDLFLRIYI